jgi:hypothetical protein
MKIAKIFLLLFLLFPPLISAQYYFGKNKVQYSSFDWEVFTTSHFNIYFYPEEKSLAEIAGKSAEESFTFLQDKFNFYISKKIPLIVYSSPNYFEQTNVIPELLPENVAGFTEFLKGRMVIPFSGSYYSFAQVIRHELVHVFTYEKLSYLIKARKKYNIMEPPLWFTEGLAEHWSKPWDSEADMILRDLVISGKLSYPEDMGEFYGTFFMYKIGESFCQYLAQIYGDEKISELFDNYWKEDDFTEIFEFTFQKELKEVFSDWSYYLKKKYFPQIKTQDYPEKIAKQLTFDGYNLKPSVYSQNGEDWIVFKANKLGYAVLSMISPAGEKVKKIVLLKGERSAKFESLHLLKSKIEVSKQGNITFVSKSRERDFLYIYDLKKKKVERGKNFSSLIELSSPTWSPDGKKTAFIGVEKGGNADLYIFSWETDSLYRLTQDIYEERDPAWSPDGKYIVFSSDRGILGKEGFLNLFLFDLEDKKLGQLTFEKGHDISPAWSPDSKTLVFVSDQEGNYDLYLLKNLSETIKISSTVTGIFEPAFSSDGKSLVFSAYQKQSFQIFKMVLPDSLREFSPIDKNVLATNWQPERINGNYAQGTARYQTKYSFDIAQSVISYDAVYGSAGGFQAALTDMLGNHQVFFLIGNSAKATSEFFSSINLGVTYLNKTKRLNYGLGAFHLFDEYYNRKDGLYTERLYGGLVFASYPFSKFGRAEVSLFMRQSEKSLELFEKKRKAFLTTGYVSYVFDTSIWDAVGPIDGTRANLTLGWTTNFPDFKPYNKLVLGDFRRYFRLAKYSCFAFRAFGFYSTGLEPQRLYLGGSWSLRGYDRRAFYGRKVTLFSNELRFPLINNLNVNFPFGRLSLPAIRGALFLDAGNAWDEEFDNWNGALGLGARIGLGYVIVFRLDFSRRTDFKTISKKTIVDFFFGWSF